MGTLDIGLIWDEANVAVPRREQQVDVPPMRADLVDVVEQMQGDDTASPSHTDDVQASSSQATSQTPISSKSTPPLGGAIVPLVRVQNLEAQMATLLHHVRPWRQKSIAKFEARMERMIESMMDQKVQNVNKHLDAFELIVLERLAPTTDLSSSQTVLASLRDDINAIFATHAVEQ
uniref:Integrase core domain containing protein n=1 Tax=Solanum tuberosum TaxID=4113 RepID=M1DIF6_SOLTU